MGRLMIILEIVLEIEIHNIIKIIINIIRFSRIHFYEHMFRKKNLITPCSYRNYLIENVTF